MENKLKMELEALPEPETTFEALEAMYAQPKPVWRRKRTVVLIAAVLALLLCGMGWTRSRYGMWLLYDSYGWEDLESQAKKYDIVLPGELDGIPFLQMQVYGHVPQGGSLAQAMLNPLYKPVCVDYGFQIRETSPDGKSELRYNQDIFGLNFGTTKNELWRYFYGIDENGKWTSWNVPGSYQSLEYKGITLQVGDTVWHYESDGRTVYTRWVHWVDEEREVAFSLNETDYTDPNRVVACAKAIIDLNS